MIASGKLVPGSRFDGAKSIIGVAVRAGLPKPDVSSGEKLKGALLAASSIIISSGPSSVYLLDLFEKEGITTTPAVGGENTEAAPARTTPGRRLPSM